MTDILVYYPYLDGTTTSLFDLHYNIKSNIYVIIDVNNMSTNIKYINALKKSLPITNDIHFISLSEAYQKHFDRLIISFGIFRFLKNIDFKYNELLILDAGRIFYDYYVNNSKYINYVKSLNVPVFGNKINQHYFNNYKNYNIYYHKFSHQRIDFLKTLPQIDITINENMRKKTGNIDFNLIQAKTLYYNRWREINGLYAENIGKLIFEFSVLNKTVFYSPLNKTHNDGLTEYLMLFGINDNIEQQIKITEHELFNILNIETDILK